MSPLPWFQVPSPAMQAEPYTEPPRLPAEETLIPTLMLRLGRQAASRLAPGPAHSAAWELTLGTVVSGTLGPSACAALSRAAAGQRVSCTPPQRWSRAPARRPRLQVGAAGWFAVSWLLLPVCVPALSLALGMSPSTAARSLACTQPHCKRCSTLQQPPVQRQASTLPTPAQGAPDRWPPHPAGQPGLSAFASGSHLPFDFSQFDPDRSRAAGRGGRTPVSVTTTLHPNVAMPFPQDESLQFPFTRQLGNVGSLLADVSAAQQLLPRPRQQQPSQQAAALSQLLSAGLAQQAPGQGASPLESLLDNWGHLGQQQRAMSSHNQQLLGQGQGQGFSSQAHYLPQASGRPSRTRLVDPQVWWCSLQQATPLTQGTVARCWAPLFVQAGMHAQMQP